MKKLLLILVSAAVCFGLKAQDHFNIKQLSRWDDESLPDANYGGTPFSYAGCYGYAAGGREYAILGSSAYVHFIDITDPEAPVEIDKFPGGSTTVWREVTVYGNYCYSVSDATNEGLMIFDLSQLPNAVTKVSQSTQFFSSCHTLFCDEENGRIYFHGSNGGNVVILDVATNPAEPVLLAANQLEGGYIHDMYVKNNIGYANHGYEGLYIYDFTNAAIPVLLANIPTNGYCHSSFSTEDDKYLIVADEVPTGLPLLVVDIEEAATGGIEIVQSFRDPLITGPGQTVTYHNPYIKGDYLYVSSYMDGFQVFDIHDPLNPVRFAWFDTYENTEYDGYDGCWGAYPFLPSGNMIASDIQNGLFVLQFDTIAVVQTLDLPVAEGIQLIPNPASQQVKIELENNSAIIQKVEIYDMSGRRQSAVSNLINGQYLSVSQLTAGAYVVKVYTAQNIYKTKLIRV